MRLRDLGFGLSYQCIARCLVDFAHIIVAIDCAHPMIYYVPHLHVHVLARQSQLQHLIDFSARIWSTYPTLYNIVQVQQNSMYVMK